MADTPEAIKKTQKLYLLIGLILFIFTVVTVAVATVPALDVGRHGFDRADMTLGLAIASIKASLVAAIFMHLNHEKKLIYLVFGFGIVFGIALMALTAFSYADITSYGHEKARDGFYSTELPAKN